MAPLEELETDEPLGKRLQRHNFDRLIMLSDGVFAIAFTLAALEIHPPGTWTSPAELWFQLQRPLLSYAVSFAVIVAYWTAHRDTFARLRSTDSVTTLLTLALLFFVALLPAGTQLLYIHSDLAALQVYGSCVVACGLSQAALWGYASLKPGLMVADVPMPYRIVRLLTGLVVPAFFGWMVLGGASSPGQQGLWGAIAISVMVLLRRLVLPRLARPAP